MSDLERKLDQATADRKKAEVAAEEVFMKLKLAGRDLFLLRVLACCFAAI